MIPGMIHVQVIRAQSDVLIVSSDVTSLLTLRIKLHLIVLLYVLEGFVSTSNCKFTLSITGSYNSTYAFET